MGSQNGKTTKNKTKNGHEATLSSEVTMNNTESTVT